jgi:hypothetical protein
LLCHLVAFCDEILPFGSNDIVVDVMTSAILALSEMGIVMLNEVKHRIVVHRALNGFHPEILPYGQNDIVHASIIAAATFSMQCRIV